MQLFKKRCAYCKEKIEKGNEIFMKVKVPEFIEPKLKTFCSSDHFKKYLLENQGTKSKKPYCLNCKD